MPLELLCGALHVATQSFECGADIHLIPYSLPLPPPTVNNQLMCPKCRMVTVLNQVGEGGVDALPVNFDLMVH